MRTFQVASDWYSSIDNYEVSIESMPLNGRSSLDWNWFKAPLFIAFSGGRALMINGLSIRRLMSNLLKNVVKWHVIRYRMMSHVIVIIIIWNDQYSRLIIQSTVTAIDLFFGMRAKQQLCDIASNGARFHLAGSRIMPVKWIDVKCQICLRSNGPSHMSTVSTALGT